jgi:hypothetical protein
VRAAKIGGVARGCISCLKVWWLFGFYDWD